MRDEVISRCDTGEGMQGWKNKGCSDIGCRAQETVPKRTVGSEAQARLRAGLLQTAQTALLPYLHSGSFPCWSVKKLLA